MTMKIGKICSTCGDRIEPTGIKICDTCGRGIHRPCEEYETSFECRKCGDETWIGAVEF